jgi:release factor glutamine methyltransferase
VAGCRRIDLYPRFERALPDSQLATFRELVKRAAKHEPIAYLVGEKEFFSLGFLVTPGVLIPRPETETLVEWCVDHCTSSGLKAPRLWDIGTGSGCIVIACLVHLTEATAVGTDISPQTLEIAGRNAERHKVTDRLELLAADGLGIPAEAVAGGFDLILCNPPYIAADRVEDLHPRVRDFEPRSALTDNGDGLSFYRRLAADAGSTLRRDGRLAVEIGDGQSQAVTDVMIKPGKLARVAARKDRVTGRERVLVFASINAEDVTTQDL